MKRIQFYRIFAIVFSFMPFTLNAQFMFQQKINQNWQFRQFAVGQWHPATVPGTVHTDLLANNLIEDPFYRTNESNLQWIDKVKWEYRCTFNATEELLNKDIINLIFKDWIRMLRSVLIR